MYGLTQFTSVAIFNILNHFKSIRITRQILLFQIKKEEIDEWIKDITKLSRYILPGRLTKGTMLSFYEEIRKQIEPELFDQIAKELKEPKQNLEANFCLAFRMIIAITIYFLSLPQFGWLLYVMTLGILISGMHALMIAYRFLDILPVLMRRFHFQAEEYLKKHFRQHEGHALSIDSDQTELHKYNSNSSTE